MAEKHLEERREKFIADLPHSPATTKIKVTKQNAGKLADGYSKPSMPEVKPAQVPHVSSERDRVSSAWKPGPGNQHKGKASPANSADCVKVKPNQTQGSK